MGLCCHSLLWVCRSTDALTSDPDSDICVASVYLLQMDLHKCAPGKAHSATAPLHGPPVPAGGALVKQQRHAAAFHHTRCWHFFMAPPCLRQVRLFNGSALANMRMGRFDEAEQALQEALEKDPKSADTLANLITVSLHLGKPVSRHSKWVMAAPENQIPACMLH